MNVYKSSKVLLVFCTAYMSEKEFSTYTYLKVKYRNKLNVKPDLRLKMPVIEPNLEFLFLFHQTPTNIQLRGF